MKRSECHRHCKKCHHAGTTVISRSECNINLSGPFLVKDGIWNVASYIHWHGALGVKVNPVTSEAEKTIRTVEKFTISAAAHGTVTTIDGPFTGRVRIYDATNYKEISSISWSSSESLQFFSSTSFINVSNTPAVWELQVVSNSPPGVCGKVLTCFLAITSNKV